MTNPFAWFLGEVRRERLESRARLVKRLDRPWRFGVIIAVGWGASMWLFTMRSFDLFTLVTLPIFSAVVGIMGVWSMRRSHRNWTSKHPQPGVAPQP